MRKRRRRRKSSSNMPPADKTLVTSLRLTAFSIMHSLCPFFIFTPSLHSKLLIFDKSFFCLLWQKTENFFRNYGAILYHMVLRHPTFFYCTAIRVFLLCIFCLVGMITSDTLSGIQTFPHLVRPITRLTFCLFESSVPVCDES